MKYLIAVVGPTASGKTALSIELAKAFSAEIISADARQFYRGMDIGTAKPTLDEQSQAKHHFIDFLTPEQSYTAGQFEVEALHWLEHYFKKADVAIVCGGSGLYVKALTDGFDDLPATPPEIRDMFNELYAKDGLQALLELLKQKDPMYFNQVDQGNRQRVQRALEAIQMTGRPFSDLRTNQIKQRPFKVIGIQLTPARDGLYDRINRRVDKMVLLGLEKEARGLFPLRHLNALKTVGYQEFFDHFEGKMDREQAIEKIKQHTRNYAKRQFTWFRNQCDFKSIDSVNEEEIIRHLINEMNV